TRIIGGAAGGRRLRTPRGSSTRPTSDRVREALFSSLESLLGTLSGLRFLDVFAGSGAVGLEAASRGAGLVVLVEQDRTAARLISANADATGLAVRVLNLNAERLGGGAIDPAAPFDVVFLDPPYAMAGRDLHVLIADLQAADWFAPDAVVVVERDRRDAVWEWPAAVTPLRSARYGETMLWYGRVHPAPADADVP
ncbi:MAG: 16S rRNA (guanine(966)-N(2))-methyltransferase RsmD, partial [Nocardioidaceae bacterium]